MMSDILIQNKYIILIKYLKTKNQLKTFFNIIQYTFAKGFFITQNNIINQ